MIKGSTSMAPNPRVLLKQKNTTRAECHLWGPVLLSPGLGIVCSKDKNMIAEMDTLLEVRNTS